MFRRQRRHLDGLGGEHLGRLSGRRGGGGRLLNRNLLGCIERLKKRRGVL